LRSAELALVGLVTLLVPVAAAGWLYLARGSVHLPGPRFREVLPLDELPARDGAPVLLVALVWLGAAATLGLLARAARIERLIAALLSTLATGLLVFAASGISIFAVRQIPLGESLEAGGRLRVVYLSAAFAGLGGAVLGVRGGAGRPWPRVLAVFVAVSGVLDVVSAATPEIASRLRLVENATPDFVPHLASALVVPAGLALIVLARGLWRRRRRAWQLTLALVTAAALLHLLKGLDYEEAAANLVLALALVARRRDFAGPGDPHARRHVAGRALLWFGAIFAYGFFALWLNRLSADQPFTLSFAARETGASLIGTQVGGQRHVTGDFGAWFPFSVLLLGLTAAFVLLWQWLAPWRYRLSQTGRDRERAHELVGSYGVDTLAPFALRGDKTYFFGDDERAVLAYKVTAGVVVVSGDPIGPDEAVRALLERFVQFARDRDWRIAVLGAGPRYLGLYEQLGLHALYHGDEAVVETAGFSLEGRPIRKVRQSVGRLERLGYGAEILYAGQVGEELRAELQDVSDEWRGKARAKGFTMELDSLFRLDGEEAVFVIGRDGSGVPGGFLHLVVVRAGCALSLSSMPRRRETPNGFNEWLVVTAIDWARTHGFERVSLNFAPFAAVFEATTTERRAWLKRRALATLKGHGFQLENLLAFNRKFFPRWQPRYVVYEGTLDLPRVGVAGLAAEGYLPLTRARP